MRDRYRIPLLRQQPSQREPVDDLSRAITARQVRLKHVRTPGAAQVRRAVADLHQPQEERFREPLPCRVRRAGRLSIIKLGQPDDAPQERSDHPVTALPMWTSDHDLNILSSWSLNLPMP